MDEFGVIQTEAMLLQEGLDQAKAEYDSLEDYRKTLLPIKEYGREIEIANNALKRLNKALKRLGHNHLHTLDTIYFAANNKDQFMTVTVFEKYPDERHKSGIQVICEKLENTMEFSLEEVATPGRGNARKEGKKYIPAIKVLERYFRSALPMNKISSSQTSKFYKYVEIWFANYVPEAEIEDYRRHIQNAISKEF
ncbi:MAG: hypothetical protein GC136_09465 [Alphaproteobacteria bacterium]|nr:hypothetical protein [Alphaproteobacteria bacterium]